LNLQYCFNGDNNDEDYYRTPPPAVGYDLVQGPVVDYDPANYPIINVKNLSDSA